jgi:hypothetical protein
MGFVTGYGLHVGQNLCLPNVSGVQLRAPEGGAQRRPTATGSCNAQLVLLCHNRPQEGQHGRVRASARAIRERMVAMDAGLWRSGRTGTSPWAETSGYWSRSEEG